MLGNPLLLGDDGYTISRSVRLRSSASAYFNRTPGSSSNRQTWTWSGWVKRGTLGVYQSVFTAYDGTSNNDGIAFDANNKLQLYSSNGSATFRLSTAVYRDCSAWYHLVVASDTTNATAQSRARIWINGAEITAWDTNATITQNLLWGGFNAANQHGLGRYNAGGYFDGYLTEINFIDGQALTPASFGETDAITGVWKAKKYGGTYGTNGFYLNFSDPSAATAAAIGKDYSGNGNNWTPSNISITAGATYDSMLDVPTAYADGGTGRGNYAVLNPLAVTASSGVITGGNLNAVTQGSGGGNVYSTIAIPSTGKWYWEVTGVTVTGPSLMVGVAAYNTADSYAYMNSTSLGYYSASGNKFVNNGASTAYGAAWTDGDIIGVAVDVVAGFVNFYKNGTDQGSISYPAEGLFPFGCDGNSSLAGSMVFNFGQRPFNYTPPTGCLALNTQNLPTPPIKAGNVWMDATTYTGTGGSQSIVNSGSMQPDLVWAKTRSAVDNHVLMDAVRGVAKRLYSNLTNAEDATGGLVSVNSNGFSLDSSAASINNSGQSYVGWQWKKGAAPGFDIVTYTGNSTNRTIAHSLGVAPKMIVLKNRTDTDIASTWVTGHTSIAWTNYLNMNQTAAAAAASTVWQDTAPTSSVFSLGTSDGVNENTKSFIAYLFAEVAGFSKFGSYTGNGNADGPFVNCGFRPRFVMIKRADAAGDSWVIEDSARDTYNVAGAQLYANLSNAEGSLATFDFVSNGFKLRVSNSLSNAVGGTYIYAAFAENPFKYALAR